MKELLHFCVLAHACRNVGLYAHLVLWLCKSYLQCSSHTLSVIYVKFMYSDRGVENWYLCMDTYIQTCIYASSNCRNSGNMEILSSGKTEIKTLFYFV